jgi:hypothetical protein
MSGCLCLTDFEFKAARGTNYGAEALKSLLDVVEGGSIQGTRYRPAIFPPSLSRIFGLNGSMNDLGSWFREYGQEGLGRVIQNLGDLKKATIMMLGLSADEQAAARRVSVALCSQMLITAGTKGELRAQVKAKAIAGKAKRDARRQAGDGR